jgi:oligoendopeptidase F
MDKTAEDIRWDLSVFYAGLHDPQIEADLIELEKRAEFFRGKYMGKLTQDLGPAILEYSDIDLLYGKIVVYLSLMQSTEVSNPEIKAKLAEADNRTSRIMGKHLTFFELEVTGLADEALAALYEKDPVVARHRPWIENLRRFRPHQLSEPVEAALTTRSPFGPSAWNEFYDEVLSDTEFTYKGERKTLAEMFHEIERSRDTGERAEILTEIHRGLGGHFLKFAAQTLYVNIGKKQVEDAERGYANPMSLRNKANRISDEVVEALHSSVMQNGGELARRYYRLKAKLLGQEKLKWSDRNAALPSADIAEMPFKEAMQIVHDAYASFSPTLAGIVDSFFKEKRVDVPAMKTKRQGAFNSSVIIPGNKVYSFTFLNYLGSPRDVMTLAHEVGHGVHAMLAGEAQGPLMFGAPIAYCETASVFGEMLTFEFLRKRIVQGGDKTSLLMLTAEKIEDSLNTIVRQIGMSNFERRMHGMNETYSAWTPIRKLSSDELNEIWIRAQKEMYGEEGDVFTYEHAERLWSYVHHFHSQFYVYGYAFGELLTQSLFAQRETLGDRFEPLYLDLLRAGGTKDAIELLAPFGLDPRDPQFWMNGLEKSLGTWIKEAEELSEHGG